jgi:hypothetical protein
MAAGDLRVNVRQQLSTTLAAAGDLEGYLQSAVEGVSALLELDGSFTLSTTFDGRPVTVATSDRNAWQADQVEFDASDGPCFELLQTRKPPEQVDLATERRWPAWSGVAGLLGFRSAAAVGLELDSGDRMVLNGYSTTDALLSEEALDRSQQFMEELGYTIPVAIRLNKWAADVAHLQEALVSRSTIDQALGVLMAQNRCSRDEAFGLLRRASQNRNVKLRSVAVAIIERYTGHPAAPPPEFRRSS